MTECRVCHRSHREDQPCPLRVANAYMMQPQALEKLTEADKKWMASNSTSVLDILEDELADQMSWLTMTPTAQHLKGEAKWK